MHITLSPRRHDGTLSVSKSGDVLIINGEAFYFSSLPDGATIPAGAVPCEWIIGPVERVDGTLRLTLVFPHDPNPAQAVAFPAPLIDPPDGELDLPRDPEPEPDEENSDVDA